MATCQIGRLAQLQPEADPPLAEVTRRTTDIVQSGGERLVYTEEVRGSRHRTFLRVRSSVG
ncbi:MAG: hypothetical protein COT81_03540 [Candidatus Buchananbacteria bacterium CG10_big_fil_rev_8_21_14_0_10_42_9]|uniref:Uncharacterized protein n=1 Tax=Candidatus Buchananbacteria bacterium CG10_big_fil_rev_8_21_14_0_10_42_9 TaxID=1974526 RepID=A0A2H0W103_9BACT|nr:MAG: hypothetical protein COT81_03540 [Candidatus Buchananbacteria bacterium CG10_big_fil_rev_8_21_14_0_10_42_9]